MNRLSYTLARLSVAATVAASGCTGSIPGEAERGEGPAVDPMTGAATMPGKDRPATQSPGGTGGAASMGPVQPAVTSAAPARIRRLTGTEISNSLRDIFGVKVTTTFGSELQRHDFDNQFASLGMSAEFAASLQGAAEETGAFVAERLPSLLECDPGKAGDVACAGQFLDRHGLRLYRRPLAEGERAVLLDLFKLVRRTQPFAAATGAMAEAMVQSPQFAYRTEMGADSSGGKTLVPLTPYETAAALSYFLWRSAPDVTLLEAAAGGKLASRAGVAEEARRLLQDARAKSALESFFLQWLELAEPEALRKPDPAFTPGLADSMVAETRRFIQEVVWSQQGSVAELLTAPFTFANAEIARLYGVTGPKGAELQMVRLPADVRAGILTQPAFLAAHTPGDEFSPVFLGRFVRVGLLCNALPPPPPGVPPVSQSRSLTTRQKYAQHSSDPKCSGCHRQMDPIGFGFETFDIMGRHRRMDGTVALTGQGELTDSDVDGKFTGGVELAKRLAGSRTVAECFAAHLMKFMLGRETAVAPSRLAIDRSALASVVSGGPADTKVQELLAALVTTDAFLVRDASGVSSH